jgi:LmbE family N-acetylglucosaminyl deacetylase
MQSLGTMLGVWAHPDDETYLTAGLMADAVKNGQRVVCVTATRGEGGSFDEERWPAAKMGKIREAELMASLAVLGVTEHRWLDYHDGNCADVPKEEGTGRIKAIMKEVQPDSVFTFGPDGMTDHPDHKAVCAWTSEAFEQTAKPGSKLYYATMTPEWAEQFVPVMNRFNVFMSPDTPPVMPREELAIDFPLSDELLDLKLKAIEEHVSQVEGMLTAFGKDFFREAHKAEFFRLAASQ